MSVHPLSAGEFSIVRLPDEIDLGNASTVLESLFAAISRDGEHLVVDARDVRFIDSSGLNALLRARERADAMDGSFHLVSATRRVTRLLELTRLDDVLHRVDSVDDAVACLARPGPGHACRPTPAADTAD